MLHANCLPIHHSLLIFRLKSNRIEQLVVVVHFLCLSCCCFLVICGDAVTSVPNLSADTISRKFRNQTGPKTTELTETTENSTKQKFQYFLEFYWTARKTGPQTHCQLIIITHSYSIQFTRYNRRIAKAVATFNGSAVIIIEIA